MSEGSKNWQVTVTPVGPLQMNSVLLTASGPAGGEAILIDPGEEAPRLLALLEASDCRLRYLLATHGHFDHIGAAAAIQQVHNLPLLCHAGDWPLIQNMQETQTAYGLPQTMEPHCQAELVDGDTIPFADQEITVRHVPGHSPGHLMFVLPGFSPLAAVVGDCLFYESVGRTDLPGGDFPTLERSVRERIYALPDDTVIIPGHGPNTSVGHEKFANPFIPLG